MPGVIEAPGFKEADMDPIFKRMARNRTGSRPLLSVCLCALPAAPALTPTKATTHQPQILPATTTANQEDGGAFPEGFTALVDLVESIVGPSELPERCADLRNRLRSLSAAREELTAILQGEDPERAPPLSLAAVRALSASGFFAGGGLGPAARFAAAGVPLESSAKIQVYWHNFVRAAQVVMPGTIQARRLIPLALVEICAVFAGAGCWCSSQVALSPCAVCCVCAEQVKRLDTQAVTDHTLKEALTWCARRQHTVISHASVRPVLLLGTCRRLPTQSSHSGAAPALPSCFRQAVDEARRHHQPEDNLQPRRFDGAH